MQQAGPGTPGLQPRGRGTQMRWETEGPGVLWGEGPVEYLSRGGCRTQSTCHCVEMTSQLCEVYTPDFFSELRERKLLDKQLRRWFTSTARIAEVGVE